MDNGPWALYEHGALIGVISDDFKRDVVLEVTGDFADDAERLAYCEWLAGVLNDACAPDRGSQSQRLADAGFTRRDTRSQCDECGALVGRQFLPIHECADNGSATHLDPADLLAIMESCPVCTAAFVKHCRKRAAESESATNGSGGPE